jgi:hypothetical protein
VRRQRRKRRRRLLLLLLLVARAVRPLGRRRGLAPWRRYFLRSLSLLLLLLLLLLLFKLLDLLPLLPLLLELLAQLVEHDRCGHGLRGGEALQQRLVVSMVALGDPV